MSRVKPEPNQRPTVDAPRRASTGRAPGSALIAAAAWLLALTGAGALFVSFTALTPTSSPSAARTRPA